MFMGQAHGPDVPVNSRTHRMALASYTMEPLLELFRQHLGSEKRSSAHTLRAYLGDLDELFAHARSLRAGDAGASPDPGICPRRFVARIWASLHGRNDPATVGRKLSAMKTFSGCWCDASCLRAVPWRACADPSAGPTCPPFWAKTRPRVCSNRLATTLSRPLSAHATSALGVLYGSGLRISEACHLDLDDVVPDGAGARITVRQGKGRKDRIVPLGSKGWDAIQAYLPLRAAVLAGHAAGPVDSQALFLSRRGRRPG